MAGPLPKKAVLVWLQMDQHLIPEMRELCLSAGYIVEEEVCQKKNEPDPRFYLGAGKVEELLRFENIGVLIFATELTPSQIFNISSVTGKTIIDRTRIILDIFRDRASSPESRLQVEIADLRYQMPILREYIHQGKLSERPGFMAGGEYKIDYYYEMIKKRTALLRKKLQTERKRREQKRVLRKRKGLHTIAIAGYTNAGKSTLMNRLMDSRSEAKHIAEGKLLFTTIATSTRKMKGDRKCIISDTVGFITDLPPWLVEGFMSTLEEIFTADIVILVVDASESMAVINRKLKDSLSILRSGGTDGHILVVFNKIDKGGVFETEPEPDILLNKVVDWEQTNHISGAAAVSALNGSGIDELLGMVLEFLPPLIDVELRMPAGRRTFELASQLKRDWDLSVTYADDGYILLRGRIEERTAGYCFKKVEEEGGSWKKGDALKEGSPEKTRNIVLPFHNEGEDP
ncbi:MAG: GTPase HflX [Thermoplasmatota archaeon]